MGTPCLKPFGRARLIDGQGPAVQAGISEAEADELRRQAQGAAVLEVGSAWGYSAIVMAKVARHLVSVDPHQALGSLETFQTNLEAHGVREKVTAFVLPSRQALPELLARGRRFDLIFIDGDHDPDAVRYDALWARHLVTERGVIAFHDYHEDRSDPIRQGLVSWPKPGRLIESLALYFGRWN